jgi:hypothetical protein
MSDDVEAILKQLTPRGAGPTLRTSVLDAVAEHLPNARATSDRPAAAYLSRWDRWPAVGVAAAVLLAINLLQAYARLPSSSRQLAAVQISPDGHRLYVYSDLRAEPAPSLDSDRLD